MDTKYHMKQVEIAFIDLSEITKITFMFINPTYIINQQCQLMITCDSL